MDKKYQSILGIVIGFSILYFLFDKSWLIYTSIIIGLSSLLSARLATYINVCWNYLVKAIGFINSYLLLGLVFFLLLTPIAFLYRLFNKDQLFLKGDRDSYFKERNTLFVPEDLENPW